MRTALVTGASSGIGEATARRLSADGYRVVVVARREDRLKALADELPAASYQAVDLLSDEGPATIAESLAGEPLHLLVNNAGAAWRSTFAEGGWANVKKHMELNFDAQVRLTEALLPKLRESAPSAIVNVSSTAGRVGRAGSGAYSAAKFAFAGWTDSLLYEEAPHGVHVGLVLPGFVATEGFPQQSLVDNPRTRWIVSTPDKVADAIVDCANGRAERYVPRAYWIAAAARIVAPRLVRRVSGGANLSPPTTAE